MAEAKVNVVVNRGFEGSVGTEKWRFYRGESYDSYRQKWFDYPQKQYLSDFPLHLDIEVTNACNLKCPMCPRTIMIAKDTMPKIGFIDFEFYKSLIDQGAANGMASMKFNYLGEPLLHPKIVEMVAYAKDAGVIDTMINTNGVLLTEKMSEALLDAGLDNLFVSIDSANKERYEAIRVGAKFEEVVDNIKNFVSLKESKGKKHVQTRVSMVVMEENADEVETYKAQWADVVDSVGWGPATDDREEIVGEPIPNFCCDQLWQRLLIMWDGECIPCCVDEKREIPVGNAKTTPLKDIWLASPVYKKLREYHTSGRSQDIERCRRCPLTRISEQ